MTAPALAFRELGGALGLPTLVLGPSLGTSTILWEAAAPVLCERYRLLAWDLPGHGSAPAAEQSFTVADLADAVAASIDGPFFYAGVSLGGATGLELLLRHREQVRAAAIIASGARIGDPAAWLARAVTVRAESTSSIIVPSAQRWFAPGSVAAHPELTGRLLHALQNADDESYALCCEALATYDVRSRLAEISTPVLALQGREDAVTPVEKAVEIARGVARGEIAVIDDAAHLPPAEQPVATAEALLGFFLRATEGA
jgi:3-oxoadipate enol-lactonase